MSSYLLGAPPPDASASVRGLVNLAAQTFAGLKTFRSGAEVQTQTAGASDKVLRVGTTVADGSVHRDTRLLSILTGMGGTEKEWVYVRRPTAYGDAPVVVDVQGLTNTQHLYLQGAGAGIGGLAILGGSNLGSLQLHAGQNGGPAYLAVINKGLHFSQNANGYDSSALMKFTVEATGGVAATVPVFDFRSTLAPQANQRLASWKANSVEQFGIGHSGNVILANARSIWFSGAESSGSYIYAPDANSLRLGTNNADRLLISNTSVLANSITLGTAGTGGLQTGTGGVSVAASSFELSLAGGWGLADVAGTRAIKLNSGTTLTTGSLLGVFNGASEKLKVGPDGTIEATTAGVGLVLQSPDGTRWRLTITNTGAVNVAAA